MQILDYSARQIWNFEMLQPDWSVLEGNLFFQFTPLDIIRIDQRATDIENEKSFLMQKLYLVYN